MSDPALTTIVDLHGDRVSRGRPLVSIGTMSAAPARSRMALAAARKNGKNANKHKKQCGRTCQTQVANCQEFVIISCSDQADAEACRERALPCCDPLSTCDATAMLECFLRP
jgi:hypothetical protein